MVPNRGVWQQWGDCLPTAPLPLPPLLSSAALLHPRFFLLANLLCSPAAAPAPCTALCCIFCICAAPACPRDASFTNKLQIEFNMPTRGRAGRDPAPAALTRHADAEGLAAHLPAPYAFADAVPSLCTIHCDPLQSVFLAQEPSPASPDTPCRPCNPSCKPAAPRAAAPTMCRLCRRCG